MKITFREHKRLFKEPILIAQLNYDLICDPDITGFDDPLVIAEDLTRDLELKDFSRPELPPLPEGYRFRPQSSIFSNTLFVLQIRDERKRGIYCCPYEYDSSPPPSWDEEEIIYTWKDATLTDFANGEIRSFYNDVQYEETKVKNEQELL